MVSKSIDWSIIGSVFGLLTAVLWISFTTSHWYMALVPVLFLVLYYVGFSFIRWWHLLFLVAPLSINLEHTPLGFGIALPTEPILISMLAVLFAESLFRRVVDQRLWQMGITKAIIFYVLWMFVTALTSTDLIVSLKSVVSTVWFVGPIFFLGTTLLTKTENPLKIIELYLWPFCGVAIYAIVHLMMYNFAEKPSMWVMHPFYKDHTQIGAVYAMMIPLSFLLFVEKKGFLKWSYLVMTAIFIVGLYCTFSRASVLSLAVGVVVYFLLILKTSPRRLALLLVVVGMAVIMSVGALIQDLERNNQESSENFVENIESVSNISTDASNLERLNRWACAVDMFTERPVFGWGPGTYKFEYAKFQRSSLRTIISTDFGDVGSSHSEYLGPLAESGLLGFLSIVILFGTIFFTGFAIRQIVTEPKTRRLLIAVTVALSTYLFHGLINEFLTTDKVSIPFWGLVAILASISLKVSSTDQELSST